MYARALLLLLTNSAPPPTYAAPPCEAITASRTIVDKDKEALKSLCEEKRGASENGERELSPQLVFTLLGGAPWETALLHHFTSPKLTEFGGEAEADLSNAWASAVMDDSVACLAQEERPPDSKQGRPVPVPIEGRVLECLPQPARLALDATMKRFDLVPLVLELPKAQTVFAVVAWPPAKTRWLTVPTLPGLASETTHRAVLLVRRKSQVTLHYQGLDDKAHVRTTFVRKAMRRRLHTQGIRNRCFHLQLPEASASPRAFLNGRPLSAGLHHLDLTIEKGADNRDARHQELALCVKSDCSRRRHLMIRVDGAGGTPAGGAVVELDNSTCSALDARPLARSTLRLYSFVDDSCGHDDYPEPLAARLERILEAVAGFDRVEVVHGKLDATEAATLLLQDPAEIWELRRQCNRGNGVAELTVYALPIGAEIAPMRSGAPVVASETRLGFLEGDGFGRATSLRLILEWLKLPPGSPNPRRTVGAVWAPQDIRAFESKEACYEYEQRMVLAEPDPVCGLNCGAREALRDGYYLTTERYVFEHPTLEPGVGHRLLMGTCRPRRPKPHSWWWRHLAFHVDAGLSYVWAFDSDADRLAAGPGLSLGLGARFNGTYPDGLAEYRWVSGLIGGFAVGTDTRGLQKDRWYRFGGGLFVCYLDDSRFKREGFEAWELGLGVCLSAHVVLTRSTPPRPRMDFTSLRGARVFVVGTDEPPQLRVGPSFRAALKLLGPVYLGVDYTLLVRGHAVTVGPSIGFM